MIEYYNFYRKKIRKKDWNLFDFLLDLDLKPDPGPLFPEVDPRIRIQIKMKRIRNTEKKLLNFF